MVSPKYMYILFREQVLIVVVLESSFALSPSKHILDRSWLCCSSLLSLCVHVPHLGISFYSTHLRLFSSAFPRFFSHPQSCTHLALCSKAVGSPDLRSRSSILVRWSLLIIPNFCNLLLWASGRIEMFGMQKITKRSTLINILQVDPTLFNYAKSEFSLNLKSRTNSSPASQMRICLPNLNVSQAER